MSFKHLLASAAIVGASLTISAPAQAGPDEYIGEIMVGGWNFCPRASIRADGTLLPIAQNTALFSLYGTTYGGDGRTTFAVPSLRGRAPIHNGRGAGLTDRPLGSKGGSETNIMTINQMPAHNHTALIQTTGALADTQNPRGDAFGATADPLDGFVDNVAPSGRTMHADTITVANRGGNQQQNNMQPYQAVMYCVVTQGVFPSRN